MFKILKIVSQYWTFVKVQFIICQIRINQMLLNTYQVMSSNKLIEYFCFNHYLLTLSNKYTIILLKLNFYLQYFYKQNILTLLRIFKITLFKANINKIVFKIEGIAVRL